MWLFSGSSGGGSVEAELKEKIRVLTLRNQELEAMQSGSEHQDGIVKTAIERFSSLCVFLGCLSITAVILESWEHTLSREVQLTFFVPLMIGHGGNTGGAVVGSTLGSMKNAGVSKTVRREVTVGVLVGSALAAVATGLPVLGIAKHTTLVVTVSLLAITVLSAALGAVVPFAVRAANLDPHSLAPPAVTTLIDAFGLITYLMIADKLLPK